MATGLASVERRVYKKHLIVGLGGLAMRTTRTLPSSLRLLGLVLCGLLLSPYSYSQEVIPEVETVIRDGLVYHQLSTEPLTGTVVSFHDDGRLRERENYRDGKLEGPWESFYENGQ